jgi:PAS domain S-box-containing protein
LLDLALAAGVSLDPQTGTQRFVDALAACRGISAASVWLFGPQAGGTMEMLAAAPAHEVPTQRQAAPLARALRGRSGAPEVRPTELEWPSTDGSAGTATAYRLSCAGALVVRRDAGETETVLEDDAFGGVVERLATTLDDALTYTRLVEEGRVMVYRADRDWTLSYVNPAAMRMLGHADGELLGLSLRQFVAPSHRDEVDAFYAVQFEAREPETYLEFPILTRSGSEVWIGQRTRLLVDEAGDPVGVRATARDVSELRRRSEAEGEAREVAAHASRTRERFLANMSHELRTPLNAIIGMGALLAESSLPPEPAGYLRTLRVAADAMLSLIDDLLDLTKLETGEIRLEQAPFEPREVLARAEEALRVQAEAKALALRVDVRPDVPRMLVGDPRRLQQIAQNLIAAAVTASERGEVALELGLGWRDGPTCSVDLVVQGGEGAAVARGAAGPPGTATQEGLAGLGTDLVRGLVERQGGATTARDGRVVCQIPYLVADGVPTRGSRPPADLSGKRVLVVEDNPLNQLVVRDMLERWGAEVEIANDGGPGVAAALGAAEAGRPFDVVLMDLQMPKMDGFEATRLIRAHLQQGDLPVLALTASTLLDERDRLDAVGMDELIVKPFRPAYLRERIAAHLGLQDGFVPGADGAPRDDATDEALAEPDAPDGNPGEGGAEADVLDAAVLVEDTGADAAFMLHLLDLFAEVAPEAGVSIRAARDAREPEALARAAHKMKSSAGIVGATALHRALTTLDRAARDGDPAAFGPLADDALDALQRAQDAAADLRGRVAEGYLPGTERL